MSDSGALASAMGRIGLACWRRPWVVISLWLLLAVAAGMTLPRLPERLLSGSGDIAGSQSAEVDAALREHFPALENQALLLVFRSRHLESQAAEAAALEKSVARSLLVLDTVEAVEPAPPTPGVSQRPRSSGGQLMMIRLKTATGLASEQQVPRVRAAVDPLFEAARKRHTDLDWAVTGRPALTYDINIFSSRDSARSELRALPLTLSVLVLAFGSVVAAMLPLLLAATARTLALGLVFIAAGALEVSNVVVGIVTMLAIALSIDYSLFLIHRYRAHLKAAPADDAIRAAMEEVGPALLFSGLAVAIGMAGLLLTPLMQTRSIGLGGIGAVLVGLLASLTILPAVLALIPQRYLDWPAALSRRLDGSRSRDRWRRWATAVVSRPLLSGVAALTLLLAMAAPALETRFGFPEEEFLPHELEYARGLRLLEGFGLKGLAAPITILVRAEDGQPLLSSDKAPAVTAFVQRVAAEPTVSQVIAPLALAGAQLAASAPQQEAMISADGSRLIVRAIPDDRASLAQLQTLSRQLRSWLQAPGLTVEVGGQASYYNDFDRAVSAVYPLVFGVVLGLSALALLLMFRAPLIALKAIVLNLLSVAAGYGAVVAVFQMGFGAELFGLAQGTETIPVTIPLVMFAILFGVSMDYEIFLLTRVRALFMKSGDHTGSVIEGVADTGTIITSAALVMVGVFGAFAFAEIVVVQMIGLGLAIAVLVDATLIRTVLGPALMQLAGRWNWWPLDEPSLKRAGRTDVHYR